MGTTKWPIAIPLAILLTGASAWGSAIRDEAKMFSPRVVEEAQRRLERLEKETNIPVVIETVEHTPGISEGASSQEKREGDQRGRQAARCPDPRRGHLHPDFEERSPDLATPDPKTPGRTSCRRAAAMRFARHSSRNSRRSDSTRGSSEASKRSRRRYKDTRSEPHGPVPERGHLHRSGRARRGQAGGGSSVFSTFLLIGLGILAVLIVLRVLGGLFGRGAGGGYPNQMGAMGGPRPGMGPGGYYGGGPGYGGRGGGGGFFSGLLGGLGGAMAGNWLYDQMSGRHGGMNSAGAGYPTDESVASAPDQGDDAIIGADDHGGQGGSWDNGGTDTGGGDWGGGDAGGDWGGGGGDWGGRRMAVAAAGIGKHQAAT